MLIQSRFLGILLTCFASVAQADALMTPNEALSPTMASDLRDARRETRSGPLRQSRSRMPSRLHEFDDLRPHMLRIVSGLSVVARL
jgi:hypothetical protein